MQFSGAKIMPNPMPINPERKIPRGINKRCEPKGKPYQRMIGRTTRLLIVVIITFANMSVVGKMILGKKTKCMILLFPDNEVTEAINVFPKQLQTITPIKTQTG